MMKILFDKKIQILSVDCFSTSWRLLIKMSSEETKKNVL